MSTKTLHLIGKTGVGKSTTGNVLVAPDDDPVDGKFDVGSGALSATSKINGAYAPHFKAMVYDTPGLEDTGGADNREKFFKEITQNLYDHGGIVVFVHDQSRVSDQLKTAIEALKLVLGPLISSSCILVTTKMEWSRFKKDKTKQYEKLTIYQESLQQGLGIKFCKCFGYTTQSEESTNEFVRALQAELKGIGGVEPKKTKTWESILRICDKEAADQAFLKKCLEDDVAVLKSSISDLEGSIRKCEKVIRDAKTGVLATCWIPFANAISAAVCAVVIVDNLSDIRRFSAKLHVAREELVTAQQNLKENKAEEMVLRAQQTRDLITK